MKKGEGGREREDVRTREGGRRDEEEVKEGAVLPTHLHNKGY